MYSKSKAAIRFTALLLGGGAISGLALSAAPAFAQAAEGTLGGTVTQAGNGALLGGATVRIVETGQTAVTDTQGSYRFGNVVPGSYTVTVDYLGFMPQSEQVTLAPGAALRHDAALGEDSGAIVVSGQRAAQARALSVQRASDNTRNVVSADQAGRFPDFNAAEALRRVPGVSVQREVDAGEGRYISIRGLDSGLNNTQINGMNAAQPEKENRRVPLDMIQTSALASITVHKTLLPDQEADGIGGAVVLETATAFDYRKPVIDLTVSGFYHDLAGKVEPMVQGTLATKFGDNDQFGILVSGAWSKRKTRGFVFYQDEDYMSYVEDEPSSGVTPYQYHQTRYDNDRENISGNLALNWAPSDATQFTFKGSYNRLHDKELSHALYFEGGTDEYDDDGNLILTEPGTANIFNQYEETILTQQSYVLSGITHTGGFTFEYGAGYSAGKRTEPFDNEVAFTKQLESNLFDYDFSGKFPVPNLTANDIAAIADPDGYELGYNDIDIDDSKNTRYSAHLDVTYEPSGSWLQMIKFGAKAERSRKILFEGNVMDLSGPLTLNQFGTGELIDTGVVGTPYAPFLSLNLDNLMDWRNYSQHLVDTNSDFENGYVEDGAIPIDGDSYTSDEDTYAAYAMAKGAWDKLEVIGGARFDYTRVSADNWEALELEGEDPVFTKIKSTASYTNILPRLQVNYRASDNFVVRGAFYTSIARPEPLYMSGAISIEEDDGEVDVEMGNPNLKPSYAYNFDLSVERYFGSIGLISGGVYYKKIKRFIFSGTAPETEGDLERFENDPRLAGKTIDDVVTYTNGKNADIYGIEFNLVKQFTELPGALGGLGIYANATFQHSKADAGIEGLPDGDFFNAPNTIFTGALTYQKYGIEGTLAYSWRDKQAVSFSSYNTRIVEQAYGSLDAQLRYTVVPGVKLFVNAVDVLNSGKKPIVDQRYGEGSPYLQGATYTGRTMTFGINASF
ncbi:MAG: TonB-dependent receptor [Candidatus Andeanibacterium colombiense]|uniref:TonB-dependent receptor n=1 Tax=Candidatus Andeanibacterium colombiense TaxID=3121345 RepID=A0AAJ5X6C2_9SPHN|nr:MAG: TonB-dependent receptor [Sphingomonadaceae bacterium]